MNKEKNLIKKIEDICEDHLANTDIKKNLLNLLCEDSHDYYLLGKVDMAQEILERIESEVK
jgi:hypothetical protein